MMPPRAHISADLDTIDTHLAGYGFESPACDRIYHTSVPRMLDLLDRVGVQATLFVIAQDAEKQAPLWREVVRRGHEIASHSVTHPIPFASLGLDRISRELEDSRRRLEDVTGQAVVGFRAPGWDVTTPTLRAIARAGYRYDASILPSPALLAGAVLRFVLSGGRKRMWSVMQSVRMAASRRLPHRTADGQLWEFPVAVSPLLRLPFTHTLWYLLPAAVCRHTYGAIRRSGMPLCYQFHAADLLDLERDGIDARMARHPGMRLPLERKISLLESFLREIASAYSVVPYARALPA